MPAPFARWAKAPDDNERKNIWHAFTPEGLVQKKSLCKRSFISLSAALGYPRIPSSEHSCSDCLKAYQKLFPHDR